jgi:hypothetical protein
MPLPDVGLTIAVVLTRMLMQVPLRYPEALLAVTRLIVPKALVLYLFKEMGDDKDVA